MTDRFIRVPKEQYDRARQLQVRIMKDQQLRVPLWRCMSELDKRKVVRDDFDLLNGVFKK